MNALQGPKSTLESEMGASIQRHWMLQMLQPKCCMGPLCCLCSDSPIQTRPRNCPGHPREVRTLSEPLPSLLEEAPLAGKALRSLRTSRPARGDVRHSTSKKRGRSSGLAVAVAPRARYGRSLQLSSSQHFQGIQPGPPTPPKAPMLPLRLTLQGMQIEPGPRSRQGPKDLSFRTPRNR